jgi:glyoxylase-like metal-dependent hydrolase (beta-lactamase superfamily II)
MTKESVLPSSAHFELREIAGGVYAAIGRAGGGSYSNAGIVDLGDRTLIVDTFMTPQAAEDLRSAAEALTGRQAAAVIITHAHSDHWMGNQVFSARVPIIASKLTRASMPDSAGWLVELKEKPEEMEAWLEGDRQRLEVETDPERRAGMEKGLLRLEQLKAALPGLELRYPDVTIDGDMVFHGTRRRAELVLVEPGHTPSDLYLVLPEEKVLFMGDLGFFASQPFTVYCDPAAWVAQCQAMEAMDVEVFVPGHGPLGTKQDIALLREYILMVQERVQAVIDSGGTVDDALAIALPEPYGVWQKAGSARWEANVRTTFEKLSGKGTGQD